MTQTFRHGMVIAALFIGVAATAVSAQQGPSGPVGNYFGLGGVTPHPPARCYPLIPASNFPLLGLSSGPMPLEWCAPPAVAPPLKRPEPALRVGYLYKDHGAGIGLNMSGADQRVVSAIKGDTDLQGVWGELALPLVLTYKTEFVLTIGHLFPVQTDTLQTYRLVGNPGAKRQWNPDIRWWEVDTSWKYRLGTSLRGIVGFRWSSFIVDFDRAENQQGFLSSGDAAKLNANAYIPFLGLQWKSWSPQVGCVSASVIGSPVLPGDFEYTETLDLAVQPVLAKFAPGGDYQSGYFFPKLQGSIRFTGRSGVSVYSSGSTPSTPSVTGVLP